MGEGPLSTIMEPSRRLQQGAPVGREAGRRGKGSSVGVGGRQSLGRETRVRRCASKAAKHTTPSPSPSSSEASPKPSSARKSVKVAAASSPSSASKAHKGRGATVTKGHSSPKPKATPLSTPNKKPKMQLGSDATPSTEVRFCPKMLRGCVCICIVLDT